MIKILESELIGTFLDQMLINPPEMDQEQLFIEESKNPDGDTGNAQRTEFDTFMLEKRIEDLKRMAMQVNRVEGAIERMTERWGRHVYD